MPEQQSAITPQTPLAQALTAWQHYLQDQGRSPNTIKAFLSDLKILTEYLSPDTPLGKISLNDLNAYLAWMQNERGKPCSPKTLARRITSLKSFFSWLHRYGALPANPAEKIVQKSVRSPLPTVLTDEEIVRVLAAANRYRFGEKPDARYYTLVALLLATGIKKRECVGIHLNHIDLDTPNGPTLFVRYASPQHRYKERKIALPPEWLPAFQEYMEQYQPTDQLFPWSPRRLEYLLEDIGRAAQLEKHLSFDMCRWSCALQDYKNGMEPERIRQKLGISKIQWREVRQKLMQLVANQEKSHQPG